MHVPPHDQLVQLALGHDGVGDVQPAVLPHQRLVDAQRLQEPAGGKAGEASGQAKGEGKG